MKLSKLSKIFHNMSINQFMIKTKIFLCLVTLCLHLLVGDDHQCYDVRGQALLSH